MICKAFTLGPRAAEREDWYKVRDVLDAWAAEAAMSAYNAGVLADNPALQAVYGQMVRAQQCLTESESDAMSALLDQLESDQDEANGDG